MRRGDVLFKVSKGIGQEQHGDRFGVVVQADEVVVQADELLPRSVALVAPTSRSARSASFPGDQGEWRDDEGLVEQVGSGRCQASGGSTGHPSPEELWGLDEALVTILGLR